MDIMEQNLNFINDVKGELLELLNEKIKYYKYASQQFTIQYTYFEKENDKWVMKNLLDIGDEVVKKIYLFINSDEITNINVYGYNKNYSVLNIRKKLDMTNKSTPSKIYACDLFNNFVARHYLGKCYTEPA